MELKLWCCSCFFNPFILSANLVIDTKEVGKGCSSCPHAVTNSAPEHDSWVFFIIIYSWSYFFSFWERMGEDGTWAHLIEHFFLKNKFRVVFLFSFIFIMFILDAGHIDCAVNEGNNVFETIGYFD